MSAGCDQPGGLYRPLPDYPIETFTLTDQDGDPFSSESLRGKVWVAHFFYQACSQGCSVTIEKMKEVQALVRGKPDIMLVSLNLNDEPPAVLARLAREVNAEPGQWYFLTGPRSTVHDLVQKSFKFGVTVDEKQPVDRRIGHSFDLCVVDRTGHECGHVEGKEDGSVRDLVTAVRSVAERRYYLPRVNAALNFLSGLLLVAGYVAVRRRFIVVHKACMLSALGTSAVFLGCYLYYHFVVLAGQSPRFPGTGAVWYVYIGILLSHTILAMAVAPLALTVTYFGIKNSLTRHVRLARWTLPIWLYVSITGVVVYVMLYQLFPPF